MRFAPALLVCCATLMAACHPGPVVDTHPNKVGGTIAGVVKTADAAVAVPGRRVSVVDVATGVRHDTPKGRIGSRSNCAPGRRWRNGRIKRT
jgi:hypothetical protein